MRRFVLTLAGLLGCGDAGVVVQDATSGSSGGTSGGTGGTGGPDSGGEAATETTGVAMQDGPRLVWWTPVTTPGSSVYVLADMPIADVELRLDGVALPAPPIIVGSLQDTLNGALFALPAEVKEGVATLAIRPRGGAVDSDSAELAISPPLLRDVADETGLVNLHDVTGHPGKCAWSQTGLAFADHDNDGDSDAYIGNLGSPGRLLRNDGPQQAGGLPRFVDITAELGLTVDNVASASFVDYDNDGDRDLLVGRRGPNVLLQNRLADTGAVGYVDVTAAAGVAGGEQRTMGAAWGDYDGDGDLDLYAINHAWCFPVESAVLNAQDHLYRNDDGVFVEVTEMLGLGPDSPVHSLGFSGSWVDVERDGDLDLIVINDHIAGLSGPNALWRNDGPDGQGGWRLVSVGAASGLAIPANVSGEGANGMGLAIGDVDFDGYPDVAFTNIGPNFLLQNQRDGTFVDASEARRVRRGALPWRLPSITWGVHLFDVDNDADLDLYYVGGDIRGEAKIPDALLRNGGDVFQDVTWAAGLAAFGHGKGSALVDLDHDGGLEFATAHWARPLRVFHNEHPGRGHWLVVDLVGTTSNRDALGSIVAVDATGLPRQTCFRSGNPSLGGGGELACHFGLAGATEVTEVTITWPDGQVTTPPPPAIDTRVTYSEP